MAFVIADRVKETTTTTGNGTVTLLGAAAGYQSFAVIGNANTTYYCIAAQTGTEWEVGIGTYTSSGTTLSRDTVLSSSDSGNKVVFSAGTKDVFVTYPSSKAIYDGGPLGTPSSGTVTNLTGTASININGTVGATTPNTGAFTSVTSTSGSGILTRAAATQDGVELIGRAGGTSSYKSTLTPTTLSASRTLTLPDNSGTVLTTGATVAVSNGGTGQTTYTDGQLLIGNTTGNTLAKAALTQGTGITITNGSGSITVANSGVTSAVAGTGISVSAGTGAVTITNGGVTSLTGTSNQVTVSASTGSVTLSTPQSINTTASVQFGSFGVGTAASGTTGEIRATNNVTAYYSDERLKTKLGAIDNALDKLCSLSGFYYQANETAVALGYEVKKEVGVSAQEVQRVMPEVVAPAPIDDRYLTVRYERLVPLLIEAIKELKFEVQAIKNR